jgi:hypothetical protein
MRRLADTNKYEVGPGGVGMVGRRKNVRLSARFGQQCNLLVKRIDVMAAITLILLSPPLRLMPQFSFA